MASSELHIWRAQVSVLAYHQQAFEVVLADHERERSARFFSETIRTRFILARGVLRHVLSQHIGTPPHDLRFVYGWRGKPSLPGSGVEFNISHSRDLIVVAVTPKAASVGVDVEYVHHIPQMATMAQDHFSDNEQRDLFALPPEQQERAFFTCWTRKEAYIKATGDGFSLPLRDFDVTLTPGVPPRMRRADGDDPSRWRFIHLEPLPDYVGAVCVLGQDFNVIHNLFDASILNS